MFQIIKAAKLDPLDLAKVKEAEKLFATSVAVTEQRKREYMAILEALKKKHDPKYDENSKQALHKYGAQVVDDILIITVV